MSRRSDPTEPEIQQPDRPAQGADRPGSRSSTRNTLEWVAVLVIAVILAVLIKAFLIQAFKIPSESMEPTLMPGDRVVVNKLSYRAHDIHRGDVVVFRRPERAPSGPGTPAQLIKRVIGLPGDVVTTQDFQVYVNGQRLIEPYLPPDTPTYDIDNPITVPEGQILVLGDNRLHSGDGRYFGTIDVDTVIGRAFLKIWPPGRFGSL